MVRVNYNFQHILLVFLPVILKRLHQILSAKCGGKAIHLNNMAKSPVIHPSFCKFWEIRQERLDVHILLTYMGNNLKWKNVRRRTVLSKDILYIQNGIYSYLRFLSPASIKYKCTPELPQFTTWWQHSTKNAIYHIMEYHIHAFLFCLINLYLLSVSTYL